MHTYACTYVWVRWAQHGLRSDRYGLCFYAHTSSTQCVNRRMYCTRNGLKSAPMLPMPMPIAFDDCKKNSRKKEIEHKHLFGKSQSKIYYSISSANTNLYQMPKQYIMSACIRRLILYI